MTLKELLVAQQAAGQRYQTAVDQLYESYTTLAAIDAAVANVGNVHPVPTFFPPVDNLGALAHPVYAPLKVPGDWRDIVAQKRDALIAGAAIPRTYVTDPLKPYLAEV